MSPRTKKQFQEVREVSIGKILDAALELFALEGYETTSMAQLAKKAGISKGLVYNYFDSKEALLKGLVDRFQERETEMMKGVVDSDPKKMLRNILKTFFKELRDHFHQWVFISKLTMQVDRFDFVRNLASEKYKGYSLLMEQLLSGIGHPNPDHEAKLLSSIFDGIGFQYMILKKDYPLDELEEYLIEKYCKE